MTFATGALWLFCLFVGLLWLLGRMRTRWGVHPEICRKLAHVALGIACLTFPSFVTSTWQILGLAGWFTASLVLMRMSVSPIIAGLDIFRLTRRQSKGEFYFILGVTLAFILADGDRFTYSASVLLLACADAAAGTSGRVFGKIRCWGNAKTLEGSIAFAAVGILCLAAATFVDATPPALWICGLACAATTIAEGVATRGSDNLWIPLVCVLCLRLPEGLSELLDAHLLVSLTMVLSCAVGVWMFRRERKCEILP